MAVTGKREGQRDGGREREEEIWEEGGRGGDGREGRGRRDGRRRRGLRWSKKEVVRSESDPTTTSRASDNLGSKWQFIRPFQIWADVRTPIPSNM